MGMLNLEIAIRLSILSSEKYRRFFRVASIVSTFCFSFSSSSFSPGRAGLFQLEQEPDGHDMRFGVVDFFFERHSLFSWYPENEIFNAGTASRGGAFSFAGKTRQTPSFPEFRLLISQDFYAAGNWSSG